MTVMFVCAAADTANWTCNCPDTHIGEVCDVISPCGEAECDVTGTSECVPLNSTDYECSCNTGFSGDMCSSGPCNVTSDAPCDDTGQ